MLRSSAILASLAFALGLSVAFPSAAAATRDLVWFDEFDGTSLDLSKWEPQIGTGCPSLCGWGNNELEFYRSENATVAAGMLTIEAKQESFGGRSYTSARLRTRNLGDWLYGRFEMRAKMPIGQGLWPAFWMLPTDEVYGGWAASGEIDIMEYLGQQANKVYGTIHYGSQWPDNASSGRTLTLSSGDFNSAFHTFALEWEPTEMRWYVDGQLYATQTLWFSSGQPFPAPFDERFHLLLNVAIGGNFPGDPDGNTVFPQQMVVDYVRVYEQANDCLVVYDGMEHANPFGNGWFAFNGSVGGGGIGANTVDLPPVAGETASLQTGWGSGGNPGFVGGFGRSRGMELTQFTHFDFWIQPDAGQNYSLEINLQDDDDGNHNVPSVPNGADDEFQAVVQVGPAGSDVLSGGGWQKVSIPLTDFVDDNSYHYGGNGVFDAVGVGSGGNGMMVNVVVTIISQSGADVTFRTDRWEFSRRNASIAGHLWDDSNGNGLLDAGEGDLDGVTIELIDAASTATVATTTTGTGGNYSFTDLLAAAYEVRVDLATVPAGLDPTFDPDGIASPGQFLIDLGCDATSSDGDFGFGSPSTSSPAATLRLDTLYAAAPNPFNPRTVLRFQLAESGTVELVVFDALGRLVRVLEGGELPAGSHEAVWNGIDVRGRVVASGVYFASLRTQRGRSVQRMVLLK